MEHLSFDELQRLAEDTTEQNGFDDFQIEQLEHLKKCDDCYEQFIILCAMNDVMSEAGSYAYAIMKEKETETESELMNDAVVESTVVPAEKVLAVLSFVRKGARNLSDILVRQMEQAGASLKFAPVAAMGLRGSEAAVTSAIKMEEYEDERTFVIYSPGDNELVVQIDIKNLDVDNLRIFLEFEDYSTMEVPMIKEGFLLKGYMKVERDEDFRLCISAA